MDAGSRKSPLGQAAEYADQYSPTVLFPISRAQNRADLQVAEPLPFTGVDIWNAYEVSWLDLQGKPLAAVGEFTFPADSPQLIESKSLKLYLNSLTQTPFATLADAQTTIQADLSKAAEADVLVKLSPVAALDGSALGTLPGTCLDDLDVKVTDYEVNPKLLRLAKDTSVRTEALHTHLFKSNCPVTGQPDWASVLVRYRGPAIEHAGLLKYLISYRGCSAFHEHCVESVFLHILAGCKPEALTVYACYTRRGGLDINPFRSNFETAPSNLRLARQ